jgi:hypothetical protein
MDIETAKFVISIAGAIIVVLLGIVSYFLKEINGIVNDLKVSVIQLKEFAKNQQAINDQIVEIFKRLNDLDKDVAVLKHNKYDSNGAKKV